MKNILRKLDGENSDASDHTLLARATFFSDMFSGTKILSSFQLARGYSPSILRIPTTRVTKELLDRHKAAMATRALQKAIRSRSVNAPEPRFFSPGDEIWAYYKTSNRGEKADWIRATVVRAEPHYILA